MVDFFKKQKVENLEIRDQKLNYRPRYTITSDEKMIIDVLFYNFMKRRKKPYSTKKELLKKTKLRDFDSLLSDLVRKGAIETIEYAQLDEKLKKKYKNEEILYFVEDIIEESTEDDLRKYRYSYDED